MAKEKKILSVSNKPTKKVETGITLNEYLASHSKDRKVDGVIKKWYFKKDKLNSKREKAAWDKIIYKFYHETEK